MKKYCNTKECIPKRLTLDCTKKCKQTKKNATFFSDNRVNKNSNTRRMVLQTVTNTSYNTPNCRHGNCNIILIAHMRETMTQAQKNQAKINSGYTGAVQPLAWQFCNHCVPYAMIANKIRNRLQNNSVFNTRNYLQNITATILGAGKNIPVAAMGSSWFFEQDINTTINDSIADIANDARNLFYWPNHTGDHAGTQVDYPIGNSPRGGTVLLNNLQNNLQAYENLLAANL